MGHITRHSLDSIQEVGMPKKHLRQSTLLDFSAEASTSTKKNVRRLSVTSPTRPKRKRSTTPRDHSSDSDDVGAIRFASKVPTSGSTRAADKRRRIMKVVESDSGEDAPAKSVDESDAVPVRKGKRRQVRSGSSDSASRPPTSRKTMMARHKVESDGDEDMEEEVDKDCE